MTKHTKISQLSEPGVQRFQCHSCNGLNILFQDVCIAMRTSAKDRGLKCNKRDVVTFPDSAYDLLSKLLSLEPAERITAADALQHEFITS